ncbi:MAG: glutamate mutase L [Anaerolineales bacterium]|nr:glutamate mutase L [Anaerolineales bacterium]
MTDSFAPQITESNRPPASGQQGSFLVVDCGHTNTTALFFDVTGGTYRMLAQASSGSTHASPHYDVAVGIQRAIQTIGDVLHRELLDEHGRVIHPAQNSQIGVDHFLLIIGCAQPLRTIVAGLLPEVSIASARRALSGNYVNLTHTFDLTGDWPIQRQLSAIRRARPDLIFIAGGIEGGADERVLQLVDAASIGVLQFPIADRPKIIYAGNSALREKVRNKVGTIASLHVAENVRPHLAQEQLADAQRLVNELFTATNLDRVPGVHQVASWASTPPMPTFQALRLVIDYLAALTQNTILSVDVGSDTVTVLESSPEQTRMAIRPEWGVGQWAHKVLQERGEANLARWLPEEADSDRLQTYLINRELFPNTLPMSLRGLRLLQALVQETLTAVVESIAADWQWQNNQFPAPNLVILRGNTLVNMPRPSQAILAFLNSFQPQGVFSVALDRYHLLPAVGLLGTQLPIAAVQVLEQGVLLDLGWVAVVHGRGNAGDIALKLTVQSPRLGQLDFEIAWGTLEIIPIPLGESAHLTLKPERGFDVGAGAGKERTLTIHGGRVGLMIDARGRPLILPTEADAQQQLVRQWLWDTGG